MNYFLNNTVNKLLWINFIRTCQVEMNNKYFPKTDFILLHYFIKSYVQLFRCEQQKRLIVILIFFFGLSQAKRNKAQKPVIKSVPETHYADPTVASKLKVSTPYYQGTVLERSFSAPPSPRYIHSI